MLQKDALERSRWKKRLLWFVFQKQALLSADVVHAKSETEAAGIMELFPKARVETIPNPIEPPPIDDITEASKGQSILNKSLIERFDILPTQKIVLFMGRIHPVKGLERLLNAWLSIFEKFPDWRLVIVGPDGDGYREELKAIINNNRSGKRSTRTSRDEMWATVIFVDAIYGEQRWEVYANADLFIAPSDFENFGQSIAEALCAGIPVITTTGTPWKELKEKGCGWWIDLSPHSIALALQEAMGLTDSERKAKGRIGNRLVQRHFSHVIAEEMCSLYRSLRVAE
jgi:glycosyltransferase involved in cell wall biosynthesis